MADAQVHIDLTADGKPVEALQKLIAQRIKYTNESAKESLAACAIQILISLRATTSVAKVGKIGLKAEASLYPSFFKNGSTAVPCLRFKGSKARYNQKMANIMWMDNGTPFRACQVYSFVDDRGLKARKHLIVAPDMQAAKKAASKFMTNRIRRHQGLAKLALGKLMNKAANTSKPLSDNVEENTKKIADDLSKAVANQNGGVSNGSYSLTCEDNLDYAMLALKGGKPSFDLACQKAANKIASVIKQKMNNYFFSPDIDTPFPELRRKS